MTNLTSSVSVCSVDVVDGTTASIGALLMTEVLDVNTSVAPSGTASTLLLTGKCRGNRKNQHLEILRGFAYIKMKIPQKINRGDPNHPHNYPKSNKIGGAVNTLPTQNFNWKKL